MKKDKKIKLWIKVSGNIQKEKPVINLISGNKGTINDYQDHVIGRSNDNDITIHYIFY